MLSATGIIAALAVLAITASVLETNPVPPGAVVDADHIVAADGSGDFTTIGAAVDAAAEGDVIAIRPGRYDDGQVTIDRDLTLRGDGAREQIVIVAPAGETDLTVWPDERALPLALLLEGADATITDITVEVPLNSTGIGSVDSSPLIERVTLLNAGPAVDPDGIDSYYTMWFYGEGAPVIRDSEWNGYTGVRGGAAHFEGNTITTDGISIDGPAGAVVLDNTFIDGGWLGSTGATVTVEGNEFTGGSITADGQATVVVRDNVFHDHDPASSVGDAAIALYGPGSQATIEANTISGSTNGIWFHEGATGSIVGNRIEAGQMAILLGEGSGTSVEDNTITGDGTGIVVMPGSDASLTANRIDVAARSISIRSGSSPSIDGNEICGGADSMSVATDATPRMGDNVDC